jgi:hypothetical protein
MEGSHGLSGTEGPPISDVLTAVPETQANQHCAVHTSDSSRPATDSVEVKKCPF